MIPCHDTIEPSTPARALCFVLFAPNKANSVPMFRAPSASGNLFQYPVMSAPRIAADVKSVPLNESQTYNLYE